MNVKLLTCTYIPTKTLVGKLKGLSVVTRLTALVVCELGDEFKQYYSY